MRQEAAKNSQADEAQVDTTQQTPTQPKKSKRTPIVYDRSPEKEKPQTRVKDRLGTRHEKKYPSELGSPWIPGMEPNTFVNFSDPNYGNFLRNQLRLWNQSRSRAAEEIPTRKKTKKKRANMAPEAENNLNRKTRWDGKMPPKPLGIPFEGPTRYFTNSGDLTFQKTVNYVFRLHTGQDISHKKPWFVVL